MTNDVEEFSIEKNRLDDETADLVFRKGLPLLLDLYEKYNIKATFYFTGTFVEKFAHSVKLVKEKGHEIGCHGYSHDRCFDILSLGEQIKDLKKAKNIIENEVGEIESFRAPALRINKFTVKALEECGFKIDSSVSSQRFDGPFTSAAKEKLKWLFSNRGPYYISYHTPFKRGSSSVLEIPISALIIGYIGTVMRIFPLANMILRNILICENSMTGMPLVFCFHPNEVIIEKRGARIFRRQANIIKYLFSDIIRSRLKLRNLGDRALYLLDKEIEVIKNKRFRFITMKEYRRYYENIHSDNG